MTTPALEQLEDEIKKLSSRVEQNRRYARVAVAVGLALVLVAAYFAWRATTAESRLDRIDAAVQQSKANGQLIRDGLASVEAALREVIPGAFPAEPTTAPPSTGSRSSSSPPSSRPTPPQGCTLFGIPVPCV